MANNAYVNKVQLADGTVFIDISDTTAAAGDVAAGRVFYTAAGAPSTGTFAQAQADWAQNDDTAVDYIKNRTHYQTNLGPNLEIDLLEVFGSNYSVSSFSTQYEDIDKIYNRGINGNYEIGSTNYRSYFQTGTLADIDTTAQSATLTINGTDVTLNVYATEESVLYYNNDYMVQLNAFYGSLDLFYRDNVNTTITSLSFALPMANDVTIVSKKLNSKFLDGFLIKSGTGLNSEIFNFSDNIASGDYSHAEGYITEASGNYSHTEGVFTFTSTAGVYAHAEGISSSAMGAAAHTEGQSNLASGDRSHAEGQQTVASAQVSHSEGLMTTASGYASHTEGSGVIASTYTAHAEGLQTTASGQASHAEGSNTIASTYAAHAQGYMTTASGQYAHAEGGQTLASGNRSHAEGSSTTASALYSHAEGGLTLASGSRAHAEGISSSATGSGSHAEGSNNLASGYYSHASGQKTIAQRLDQFVFGAYNIADTEGAGVLYKGDYIEIVGNGTADDARSNARTLDWSGNQVLAGKLTVGTGPSNNMDVATKQYVDSAVVTPTTYTLSSNNNIITLTGSDSSTSTVSVSGLPAVSTTDNGKSLVVSNGSWSTESLIFYITVTRSGTENDYTYTADKTLTQILAAHDAGKMCIINCVDSETGTSLDTGYYQSNYEEGNIEDDYLYKYIYFRSSQDFGFYIFFEEREEEDFSSGVYFEDSSYAYRNDQMSFRVYGNDIVLQTGGITLSTATIPVTTYTLSMNNNVITLTGSDSSTSTVGLPVYNGGVSSS